LKRDVQKETERVDKLKKLGTATQEELDSIDKWRSEIAACYSNRHARYQDLSTSDTTPKAKKPKPPPKAKPTVEDSEMQDES